MSQRGKHSPINLSRLLWLVQKALRTAEIVISGAWLQGGNAFGATGTFGTTDNNPVNVITNGALRYTIDTAGNITSLSGFLGWTAGTHNPAAAGELGMNSTTGRGLLFVGGVVAPIAVLSDLPGGGPATFPAILTSASAQYTVLSTDRLIEVDVSGGQLAGPILMDVAPVAGEVHTIAVVAGDAAVNTVGVNGNGKQMQDPNNPTTFTGSTVFIKNNGSVTWMYDGTRFVIVASS